MSWRDTRLDLSLSLLALLDSPSSSCLFLNQLQYNKSDAEHLKQSRSCKPSNKQQQQASSREKSATSIETTRTRSRSRDTSQSSSETSSIVASESSVKGATRTRQQQQQQQLVTATGGHKPKPPLVSAVIPSCPRHTTTKSMMKVESAILQQQQPAPSTLVAKPQPAFNSSTRTARSSAFGSASVTVTKSTTAVVQTRSHAASYKKSCNLPLGAAQTSTPAAILKSSLVAKNQQNIAKSASAAVRSIASRSAQDSPASLATPSSSRINKKIKIATPSSSRNLNRKAAITASYDESSDDLNGADSDAEYMGTRKSSLSERPAVKRFEYTSRLKTSTETVTMATGPTSSLTKHTKSSLNRVAFVNQATTESAKGKSTSMTTRPANASSSRKTSGQSTGRTPLKKFRKLRLFDTPRTPKTLLKEANKMVSKMDSATMTGDFDQEPQASPLTPKPATAERSPVSFKALATPGPVNVPIFQAGGALSSNEDEPMFSSPPNEQNLKNSKIMSELLSSISRTPKSSRRMRAPMSPFNGHMQSNLIEMSCRKSASKSSMMASMQFSSCNFNDQMTSSDVAAAMDSEFELKMEIDDWKRSSSVGNLYLTSMAEKKKRLECNFPPQSPALSNSSKRLSSSVSSSRFRQPFQVPPAQPASSSSSNNLRMRLFDHNGNSPTWNNMNKMLVFDDAPPTAASANSIFRC